MKVSLSKGQILELIAVMGKNRMDTPPLYNELKYVLRLYHAESYDKIIEISLDEDEAAMLKNILKPHEK